jgi:hypothetical protein
MLQPVNKAEKLDELVGSVEELLAQLPDSLGPSITALRDKVDDGIFDAWTSISRERAKLQRLATPFGAMALISTATVLGIATLLACSGRSLLNRRGRPRRQRVH